MPNFSIEVFNQESFEQALRRFSTKTRKSGILRELKKNRFYTKPSVQKKMDKIIEGIEDYQDGAGRLAPKL